MTLTQPNLIQGQSMRLTATPRLIQAMTMLQMSAMELAHYIQERALENPFLDVDSDAGLPDGGDAAWARHRAGAAASGIDGFIDTMSAGSDSLEAELLSQLRIRGAQGRLYKLAAYLAGNVNEAGYLAVSLQEASLQLGASAAEIEAALRELQALEPAGVGARTLQECLELQIARDAAADPWAYAVVSRFLDELAGGRLQRIAEALAIPIERVKQTLDYIRTLNPRPGASYGHQAPQYVAPDAAIRRERERYAVVLNERSVPKVAVHRAHAQLVALHDHPAVRRYAREHLQEAQWLVRCVEQRKATLLRVVEAVAGEQLPFLEQGRASLRPMNLRAIADKLGVDESTVSRAVSGKYVQTPHGIFELKSLFSSGLRTQSGDAASSESIKERIRRAIAEEDASRPLSDQQITDLLAAEGIRISRRTVMKYREEMRILSSKLRARAK